MDTPEAAKDQAVQSFLAEVKDWNVMGKLPEGLELADGKRVRGIYAKGFYDHGTTFGNLPGRPLPYQLKRDYEDTDQDINILSVLPHEDGNSVVVYRLKWMAKDLDIRTRETGSPAEAQFLVAEHTASQLRENIREDTTLMDRVVAAKFPKLVQNRQIIPWKKLILCPVDTKRPSHMEGNHEVIATRGH